MKTEAKALIQNHASAVQSVRFESTQFRKALLQFDQSRLSWRDSTGYLLRETFTPRLRKAVDQLVNILCSAKGKEQMNVDLQAWSATNHDVVEKFSPKMTAAFERLAQRDVAKLAHAEQELARAEAALERALAAGA
jgi:hypothetical protein